MSTVYFDISIGGVSTGRLTFELFSDITPRTCKNFRMLCENQTDKTYLHSIFHRVIPGFMAQGGDFTNSDGTGGISIYGNTFDDENFNKKHDSPGLLSMANAGRNTNGSQFFITFKATPHLNDKHVVFGRVVDGMDVLRAIEKVPIDKDDRPLKEIKVESCGSSSSSSSCSSTNSASNDNKKTVQEQDDIQIPTDPMQRKLFELRLKLNESRKLNRREVIQEQKRMENNISQQQQSMGKKYKKEDTYSQRPEHKLRGIAEEQLFMHETADIVLEKDAKRKQKLYNKEQTKERSVYNADAQYRGYEKQVWNLVQEENPLEAVELGQHKPTAAAMDKMVQQLEDAQARRKKFSRRRKFNEDEIVDSINERNRENNKRLKKYYDPYTVELRQNLERGTAL